MAELDSWDPPIRSVRIARHTLRLDEVVAFYREGIGLEINGSFEDHEGYSGVMLGLLGSAHHFEFTSDDKRTTAGSPAPDDLVVFYFRSATALEKVARRLRGRAERASPTNPYWRTKEKAIAFLDPDGWQVLQWQVTAAPPWVERI